MAIYLNTQNTPLAFGPYGVACSDAVNPVDAKIRSFAQLREGWRYVEGGPISQSTIASALQWRGFLTLRGITGIEAVPGAGREIVLAALISGRYTEIITEANGTFTVVRDHDDQEDLYESDLSMLEAKNLILGMLGKAWTTFAGSTRTNSFIITVGSQAPSSVTWEAASRWWTANALPPMVYPSAIMQGSTIETLIPLVNRQSSGGSMGKYYPIRAA
jgi:hypothetical protein